MSKRQRKSRGSLELRAGHWWLRPKVSRVDAATGEISTSRPRIKLGAAHELRSEAEARRAADAWLSRNQPWQHQTGQRIGFADYAERFLEQHAANFRSSSRRHYEAVIRRHLVRELGGLPLWAIGAEDIRNALSRRRSTGLGLGTLQGIRSVLLQILRKARAEGFDVQPIDPVLVRLPRAEVAERDQRFISAEELGRVLAASAWPWRALWAVMGLAGLRISEALGLTWDRLVTEGEAPLLRVRQGASGGRLLPLKTKTSRADLPLDPDLARLLRDYRNSWRPNPGGLLFATRSGRPMSANDIRRRQWLPLLKHLGMAHAGFHALRHGLPRRQFAAGMSAQVVQKLMRHGSLAITERYLHSTAEDLRAAMESAAARRAPSTSSQSPRKA